MVWLSLRLLLQPVHDPGGRDNPFLFTILYRVRLSEVTGPGHARNSKNLKGLLGNLPVFAAELQCYREPIDVPGLWKQA